MDCSIKAIFKLPPSLPTPRLPNPKKIKREFHPQKRSM